MAHCLSSKKRIRQNIKHRALNRGRRSAMRNQLRKCQDTFLHGSLDEASGAVSAVIKTLDREANRGTLHRNAVARRKSRLARRLNAMKQKTTA